MRLPLCILTRKTSLIIATLLIVLTYSKPAPAADPGSRDRTFVRALELFDNAKTADDYRASARELESILADGYQNGAVFYNIGNAYFRAGDFGRAILNYRKAKPLRPRDTYLEANLQQALAVAPGRMAQPPAPWWTHVLFWTDWFSYPQKVRLAALGLILAVTLSLIAVMLKYARLHLITLALFCFSTALGIDVFLGNSQTTNRGVITAETMARKGTGKDYEPAFDQPLRDGAEFTVLSQTADWTFGHFEGIGEGWVRNEFVAR